MIEVGEGEREEGRRDEEEVRWLLAPRPVKRRGGRVGVERSAKDLVDELGRESWHGERAEVVRVEGQSSGSSTCERRHGSIESGCSLR